MSHLFMTYMVIFFLIPIYSLLWRAICKRISNTVYSKVRGNQESEDSLSTAERYQQVVLRVHKAP